MRYEKPAIAIERYELTQAIAACSIQIGFASSACVLQDVDSTRIPGILNLAADQHFLSGHCIKVPSETSTEDGICYHTLSNAAFTS